MGKIKTIKEYEKALNDLSKKRLEYVHHCQSQKDAPVASERTKKECAELDKDLRDFENRIGIYKTNKGDK